MTARRLLPLAIGVVLLGGLVLGVVANGRSLVAVGSGVVAVAWVVPGLIALHLFQLLLSALGWRCLLPPGEPPVPTYWRLRIIREGIDSLLPVAQVGGEVVGCQLLARHDVPPSLAAASVIVDVTIELLTQLAFLAAGLGALAWLSGSSSVAEWGAPLTGGAIAIAGLLLAQRFGAMNALEGLLRGMARRWPALASVSLDGLHAAAMAIYRDRRAVLLSIAFHLPAWMLGAVEVWVILRALGYPVGVLQAFTVESLGMAARSVGFWIPAALGAQEGGFILAAAAVGVPVIPALTLSMVKRLREVSVGLVGLALWRGATRARGRLGPAS